jgi:hypothetical protein
MYSWLPPRRVLRQGSGQAVGVMVASYPPPGQTHDPLSLRCPVSNVPRK